MTRLVNINGTLGDKKKCSMWSCPGQCTWVDIFHIICKLFYAIWKLMVKLLHIRITFAFFGFLMEYCLFVRLHYELNRVVNF